MNIELCNIIIKKIKELSLKNNIMVNLTGGEPFLNFEVLQYLYFKLIEINKVYVSINTNFTVDIEKLKLLETAGKVIRYFVSVPSLDLNIYNNITKNNNDLNYKKLLSNLLYTFNNPLYSICVNLVLNEYNIDDMHLTINKLKLYNIKEIKISPILKCNFNEKFYKKYFELFKLCKDININLLGSSSPIKIEKNLKIDTEFAKKIIYDKCNAGYTLFNITPQGDVKPCPSCSDQYVLYNIQNQDILLSKTKEYSLLCQKE